MTQVLRSLCPFYLPLPVGAPDYERTNWPHVDVLFAAALEQAPSARSAFLNEACAGDDVLRAEVASLLAAFGEAGDFLNEIDPGKAAALVAAVDGATEPFEARQRIGPYRVVSEIGRGGMGVVYLGERADGTFEQQVALKVVKRGMDTEAILRRFLHERQILARLQHPGVARLLDGGMTDDGHPYFAMEHVEGEPLTEYCDRRRLSIEARLRLFQRVGEAVQYAHQSLIVHRDLKPSNVLVTEAGLDGKPSVKLLDFGIAKLLDAGDEAVRTETGLRAMTPEYAAPEQVRGEPVTTATDIYALGVVLYELLTGHRPYAFAGRDPAEIARVVSTEEPSKPSAAIEQVEGVRRRDGTTEQLTPEALCRARATEPEKLRRRLAGDLDTIVLKALHKEPARRYASVEAFVEDIRRYLSGMPVQARRDTLGYRTAKFVRRHKGAMVAAALILLSLVGGLGTALWQARRATQEAVKAEMVSAFLINLFKHADPNAVNVGDVTLRTVLDDGVARLEHELADQPAVRARLLYVIGETYIGLGLYSKAEHLLTRTLELTSTHYGSQAGEVAATLSLLAWALREQGKYEEAQQRLQQSLAIHTAVYGPTSHEVAVTLAGLGWVQRKQGRLDEAEATLRRSMENEQQNEIPDSLIYSNILSTLGQVLRDRGQLAEAEAIQRDVLEMRRAYLGAQHPEVARALGSLAGTLAERGQLAEARAYLTEGIALRRQVQGARHAEVGIALGELAGVLNAEGDVAGALVVYREALDIQRGALTQGHDPSYLTNTLMALGTLLREQGQVQEGALLVQEALEMQGPDGAARLRERGDH